MSATTPRGPHENELRRAIASVNNGEVFDEMALGWRNAENDLDRSHRRLRRAGRGLRENQQLGTQTRDAALGSFRAMRKQIDEQRVVYKDTASALELAGRAMRRAQKIVAKWDSQGDFTDPGPAPKPLTGTPTEAEQTEYLRKVTRHSNKVAEHQQATAARETEAELEMRRLERKFARAEEMIRVAHGLPERCATCGSAPCSCGATPPNPPCPTCGVSHTGLCKPLNPGTCARCGSDPCRCPRRCASCGYYTCRCGGQCSRCGSDPCRCPSPCHRCGGPTPCSCTRTPCSKCGSDPCRCDDGRCYRCGSNPCQCKEKCWRCGGPAPCQCGVRNPEPPTPQPPQPPTPEPHTPQPPSQPPTTVIGDPQGPGGTVPTPGMPGMPGGSAMVSQPAAASAPVAPLTGPMSMAPGSAALSARGAAPIGGAAPGASAGVAGRTGAATGAAAGRGGVGGVGAGTGRGAAGGAAGRGARGGAGGAGGRGMGGAGAAGGRGGKGRGRREDERSRNDLLADDSDWIDGEESGPGVLR